MLKQFVGNITVLYILLESWEPYHHDTLSSCSAWHIACQCVLLSLFFVALML